MAKWPRYGYCKTRLSKDIGNENALKVQQKMLFHTISVAEYLSKNHILEISIAIDGIGLKKILRSSNIYGLKSFFPQGKGCLGERMKRQILLNQRALMPNEKRNIIIIGTDLPNLCHIDLLEANLKLKNSDVVIGPSNDGGYWLIGFSKSFISNKLFIPFINIKWSKDNVLEKTVDNLSRNNITIDYLISKVDIDTISDLEQKRKSHSKNFYNYSNFK